MGTVTAMDLRNHTGRVLQRVARGERVVVTRRGEPLAIVQPARKATRQRLMAKSVSAIIAEGVGLLAGSGTIERFLAEKRKDVEREGRRWRRTR
jgi:prevent-host-death family protein